jgi:SAM-dependent MidA family methyltransferase
MLWFLWKLSINPRCESIHRHRFIHNPEADFNTISNMQLQLPEPSFDALNASRSLLNLIANDIRRNSGWISFAQYMELVLYAPGLGYYSGGAAKLGKDGDFTTAPEMTPLFGGAVAHVAADLMAQTGPQILEFGAGTGKLAHDILTELAETGVPIHRYSIVEVSGELRARQEKALRNFPQVTWLDRFPPAFSGVVIGNEVLDAMPVNLVVKTDQGWKERGVGLSDKAFVFRDRPCDPALIAQIPEASELPVGYLTEVHPVAAGFMRSLASMLGAGYEETGHGGAAILFDYGFPAHEYYLEQRAQGTLMCHYRHHAHPEPFYLPGLQDVTAHVDFTAMAHAAIDGGLEMLGYTSQAAFLLDAGIGDLLLRTPPTDERRYLPQANAMQKLISPAEMGELFKVLVVGKHAKLPDRFGRNDRSHRL